MSEREIDETDTKHVVSGWDVSLSVDKKCALLSEHAANKVTGLPIGITLSLMNALYLYYWSRLASVLS